MNYNRQLGKMLSKLFIEAGAVVIDTETTGLSGRDEVIEIGLVDGGTGVMLFSQLIHSAVSMNPKAFEVHHISNAMLRGKPTIDKLFPSVVTIIGEKPVLAYNAKFDLRMLQQSCRNHGMEFEAEFYCLMEIYKMYAGLPEKVKLETACLQMGINPGNHRALGDARAAAGILQAMSDGREPALSIKGELADSVTNPLPEDSPPDVYDEIIERQNIEQAIIDAEADLRS